MSECPVSAPQRKAKHPDWVHHSTPPGKLRTICKLIAQAVLYAIWNERNKRLHTSVARHTYLITKEI